MNRKQRRAKKSEGGMTFDEFKRENPKVAQAVTELKRRGLVEVFIGDDGVERVRATQPGGAIQ